MKLAYLFCLVIAISLSALLNAQQPYWYYFSVLGENRLAITDALPFLRIMPDARSSGMGDVGIACSADASSIHHNPSKLGFADKKFAVSASFTPDWMKEVLPNQHQYLAYLSGYARIKERHNIGFSFRRYNFGDIELTDDNGQSLGKGDYKDTEVGAAYALKCSSRFSVGIGAAFIRSSVLKGLIVQGSEIKPANSLVFDLSATYKQPFSLFGKSNEFTAGLALRKIGGKFTYTNSVNKDYVPGTAGLGLAWKVELNGKNSIALATEFNKLLVPTPRPDLGDADGNDVLDYKEYSSIQAIFKSFGDAPGGFSEELKEVTMGVGAEYWYNNMIALRAGYFHEHYSKGGRKNASAGLGFRYKFLGLDLCRVFWLDDGNRVPIKDIFKGSVICAF